MSESQPRPRHTSLAAAVVIGSSVGVVVSVAEQLTGIQSLETRERVVAFLSRPPGSGLGLEVTTALSLLRVLLMVVAGCATAAAVLGFHVLQGGTRARLGLSVLAVPIFLGGFAIGGLLTALVAAGTAMLWIGPSAYWFRGEPVPELVRPGDRPPLPVRRPGATQPPAARQPFGQVQQHGPAQPFGPPQRSSQPTVEHRPDALVWACVLVWAFSALALAVMIGSVVLMATNPELVLDELARQDPDLAADTDTDTVTRATYVAAAVAALWSLGAIALAVLAYRRSTAGRIGSMISAAVAGFVFLLATPSSLVMAVPAIASVATVALLRRTDVRAWFERRSPDRGPMSS